MDSRMSLSRWLDVEVGTDDSDLNTLPSNLALADLQNDGEFKLLVGDFGKEDEGPKLKIFRGAMQVSDIVLPDWPLGIVSFYTNDSMPRSAPAIAVAFSSCVCIYKNLKMFYKYYQPSAQVITSEMQIWKQLILQENQNPEKIATFTESLKAIPHQVISSQSKMYLSLSTDQQLEYLEQAPELPSKEVSEIVCITSMKMTTVDKYSSSCLVIGTEDGDIILLDPQNFTQLSQAKVSADKRTPYQIVATGLYNVGYRLTIVTREKCVCILKRGWSEGKTLFCTEEHIIAIEVITGDNSIMVICADNTMACYSRKGKKQWCLTLEHRPVALTLVPVLHLGLTLTAVALASGHVHLYDGKARRDSLFIRDVVSVMMFGQLGQEEHVFIIITACGNLMLKILKRTADFNTSSAGVETSLHSVVGKPWMIPKKSKLFLEQAARERETAVAMHESFQLELNRMRLDAARTLLETYSKSDNSIALGSMEPVRLSAEVEGLGPVFRMTLIVHNTSEDKAVLGLFILFHVHTTQYKVSNPYIKVPLLSPGNKIEFPTKIEEVFDDNINPDVFFRSVTGQGGDRAQVKVLLLKDGRSTPVLAATVQMPPTDPMMLPYEKIQAAAEFGNVNEF